MESKSDKLLVMTESRPSRLAFAFSARSQLESEHRSELFLELTSIPYSPLTDAFRTRLVILGAQRLDRLLETGDDTSEMLATERDYQSSLLTEYTLYNMRNLIQLIRVREKALIGVVRRVAKVETNQSMDDTWLQQNIGFIIRQIEAAKNIASEGDIIPESIFQDESLFAAAIRRSFSPSEFVDNLLPWQKRTASEANANLVLKMATELTKIYPIPKMLTMQITKKLVSNIWPTAILY